MHTGMITKKLTRAEQKALRPSQILDAAFDEFVEKGYAAARLENIAVRIGVTKGTIYVYFPTKEDLFDALVPHIATALASLRAQLDGLTGTSAEKLRSLILLFYDSTMKDRKSRELLRLAIAEGTRFPQLIETHHRALIEPVLALTQTLIEEGVRLGEFRSGAGSRARIVLAPVIGIIVEMLIHGVRRDLEVSDYIDAHVEMVMLALACDRS